MAVFLGEPVLCERTGSPNPSQEIYGGGCFFFLGNPFFLKLCYTAQSLGISRVPAPSENAVLLYST